MHKTVLILGATGLVGEDLLHLALAHPDIKHVIAPTRQPLNPHSKLENPIVDFKNLPLNASWWKCDTVLCALGTTLSQAGSREAFYTIDHGYVINAALLAKQAGAKCFVYNSSIGASQNANSFYLQTKGKVEKSLENVAFTSLYHIRPSLLSGKNRKKFRLGEFIALIMARLFKPFIPKKYRAVSTKAVAKMMLLSGLDAKNGLHVIESDKL